MFDVMVFYVIVETFFQSLPMNKLTNIATSQLTFGSSKRQLLKQSFIDYASQ